MILAAVVAVAFAAPQYQLSGQYAAPPRLTESSEERSVEHIAILSDDRVHEEDGRYNLDVETANGIVLAQSGSPDGPDGSVTKSGSYS